MAAQATGIVFSNTIPQEFDINYSLKINEFSTEFATAYDAKPRTPRAERAEYYALVFNKFFPADLDKINTYKTIREKLLQELVDFGKVPSTKGESLCCIMKKPVGVKLSAIMRNGPLDEVFVTGHLFNQLFSALSIMHSKGIMHGCINPDYIYYNQTDASITLRESVSEFVGFSQKAVYETYERMICNAAGKSHRELSADFYASGVLLLSLMMGQDILANIPNELVANIKLENGSYESLLAFFREQRRGDFAPKTELLLKGLLHDRTKERWQVKQVTGWQKKEITAPPPSRVHKQSSTPFTFEGNDYYSPKFLAHMLQQNWTTAKKNLKLVELTRWISFSAKNPETEKKLAMMMRNDQTEIIIPDEKLARIIYLIDEEGPVRYKDVAFHPDGLGNLYSYFMYKNNTTGLDALNTTIDMGFIDGWIASQENQDIYKPSVMGWNPKKLKFYIRNTDMGFGNERGLYELNPYLPCLSPLLENVYALGLPAVLTALNQGRLNGKDVENDRHLTAYICFHTDIEDSIKIKTLQNYPYFGRAMPIKVAAMFAFAQQRSGIDNLPGIANWVRQNLNQVIEKLRSNNIKKQIIANLDAATITGDLNKIFASISDAKLIRRDVYGFEDAKKQYKILTFEVLKLKSQHNMDQLAYRLGLRIAVIGSYLICSLAILCLMVKF